MRYIISFLLTILPLAATAKVPQVVTDIPPVAALVAQVMGDLGQPVLLLEKGADEHDFQLRPSQMQAIADAGLVVWIGPELTPWLDRAMAATRGRSLALLDTPGTAVQGYDPAALQAEEADHADDPTEAGHDHHGADPHAWMNPQNAIVWTGHIAEQLSQLDPDHAATYAANAAAAKARIAALDTELAVALAPFADKGFVTFHAAYGYFTVHYGLKNAGFLALGDASTPGAAKLKELQGQLRAGDFVCAFPESQHDPALLTQVMDGASVKLGAALDPVGSTLDFGPDAYEALMRGIATKLIACLNS
jgi:zinc transport system substrate-binding protein